MERLPDEIALEYRAATSAEILSWSFGGLRAVRGPSARTWQQGKGTLDDEALFGPRRDYRCACDHYQGVEYKGMICHLCGVKIAPHEIRRSRFAHVDLTYPIPHPLITPAPALDAIPVLPAEFWESSAGARLAHAYEDVVRANGMREPHRVIEAVGRAFGVLLPVVEMAHQWGLPETTVRAHPQGPRSGPRRRADQAP